MQREETPAIVRCFGYRPELLVPLVDFAYPLLFQDGLLSRRLRESIATLISARNACPYCAQSHGAYLKQQGASECETEALLCGDLHKVQISDQERALLDFAIRVNDASWQIGSDDIGALIDLGWNENQIAEAVHLTAFMGMCNRIANSFGLTTQQVTASGTTSSSSPAASH